MIDLGVTQVFVGEITQALQRAADAELASANLLKQRPDILRCQSVCLLAGNGEKLQRVVYQAPAPRRPKEKGYTG
ncbi:MAG: hypothetical protein ACRD22_18605 [Terriglobia bacterium]